MLQPITIKVAKWYTLWIIAWGSLAVYGDTVYDSGEFGLGSWIYLTVTGLPLSLLSWYVQTDGSDLGILLVGVIGLVQWCTIVEINARYGIRRKSKGGDT